MEIKKSCLVFVGLASILILWSVSVIINRSSHTTLIPTLSIDDDNDGEYNNRDNAKQYANEERKLSVHRMQDDRVPLSFFYGATEVFDLIAGYQPRTNVTKYLVKSEFINRFLTDTLGTSRYKEDKIEEKCKLLGDGKKFWDSSNEASEYLRNLPTWKIKKSDVFDKFTQYYGEDDFLNKWVEGALNRTNYVSAKKGSLNFRDGFCQDYDNGCSRIDCEKNYDTEGRGPCVGFIKFIEGAVRKVSTLIEAMQLIEAAIYEVEEKGCIAQKACMDAMKYWDASVAIFVGLKDDLLHYQNDRLNEDFCTGGTNSSSCERSDTSNTNMKIMAFYSGGQQSTYFGDVDRMRRFQRIISDKMAIPFIQGTLKHSWQLSDDNPEFKKACNYSTKDKNVARAAVYAWGVLPKVWACSKNGARELEKELKIESGFEVVKFERVKLALQCNYKCLGITCMEINEYFEPDDSDGTLRRVTSDGLCIDDEIGSSKSLISSKRNIKRECKLFTGDPGIDEKELYNMKNLNWLLDQDSLHR